jgi:hypothetical protein
MEPDGSYEYEVNPLLLNPGDSVMDVELAKKAMEIVADKP